MSVGSETHFRVVRDDDRVKISARCPDWKHAFRGSGGMCVFTLLSTAMFGSVTALSLFLIPGNPVGMMLAAVLGGAFTVLGFLVLRQLRHIGFEAELDDDKFRYVDTRPYQLNLPLYALEATPEMVDSIERRFNGIVLRLNEATVWGGTLRRAVRVAPFLEPEELDEFEEIVREWLERETESAESED